MPAAQCLPVQMWQACHGEVNCQQASGLLCWGSRDAQSVCYWPPVGSCRQQQQAGEPADGS